MTDALYFDTDCLSSFLIVNRKFILTRLFNRSMFIPDFVLEEIHRVPILKKDINDMLRDKEITFCSFDVGSEEYQCYSKLTSSSSSERPAIGKGEAAAIALAKVRNGILASNNYRDVKYYVDKYHLRHISTDLILFQAFQEKLIDEKTGNSIWSEMRARNFYLPCASFSDFLLRQKTNN